MEVLELHDRDWRSRRAFVRPSIHAHLAPEDRGRLQMDRHLRVGTQRSDERLARVCQPSVLQPGTNLLLNRRVIRFELTFVGLVEGFDLLLGDQTDLACHFGIQQGRNGDPSFCHLLCQEFLVDERLYLLALQLVDVLL